MKERVCLLICDVWDNHYCRDLRKRTESLVVRINEFAEVVRSQGGTVLHCPSDTVESYYGDFPQRKPMLEYPLANKHVYQEMLEFDPIPLETYVTTGCPDIPQCPVHTDFTKQHDGIEIRSEDLISDNGQEIYNFLMREGISEVLICGTALNMCILGRPFGVKVLKELGVPVRVVSDLVEVFYSPAEPPYIPTIDQAKWFALGYIEASWCPVTSTYQEILDIQEERNMKINTNLPGHVITRLKRKYQLDYFVETGTAGGDTAELAATIFEQVWSCDVDPMAISRSQLRLTEYPNVELSVGTSPEFLMKIRSKLAKPTLYWLDAHWCGGRVKPAKECPLLEELDAIGTFFLAGLPSVLLIDDINLMMAPPPLPHDSSQWPTMHEVRIAMDRWGEPYDFEWVEGTQSQVLIVTPREKTEGGQA